MDDKKVIEEIVTQQMLVDALGALGVENGSILEVHASLASLGYVVGGAKTVVDALMQAVGPEGTLVMSVRTAGNSEPSQWQDPQISPELYRDVRNGIPAYDPSSVDLTGVEAIAENFRSRRDVIASTHPTYSYAAWGKYAQLMCNRQSLHFPLAEESPAARLYELKGSVLLIGVDFSACTCLHLAEYRSEARPIVINGAAARTASGEREWKKYLNMELDSSAFEKVRAVLAKKNMVRETMLGSCRMQLFPVDSAVDETVKYYQKTSIYDLYR